MLLEVGETVQYGGISFQVWFKILIKDELRTVKNKKMEIIR